MKAPRLHELTARVVAWHNRHPLAQRIDASQVHSIGEVRLPFASRTRWDFSGSAPAAALPRAETSHRAPDAPASPSLAEALAQRNARLHPAAATAEAGTDNQATPSMLPDDDAALFDPPAAAAPPDSDIDLALNAVEPPTPAPPGDDDDGEAALVIPLLDGDTPPMADDPASPDPAPTAPDDADVASPALAPPPPPTSPESETEPEPPPEPLPQPVDEQDAVTATITASDATAVPDIPPAQGESQPPAQAGAPEPAPDPASAAAPGNPAPDNEGDAPAAHAEAAPDAGAVRAAPAASRWQALLAALRRAFTGQQPDLPPLRAAFSREFIWPLRPGEVARWAQRHGRPHTLAPADWPRRNIDSDRTRLATLRQKGMAHDIPLHVLTAAIGVGDRRIRVLVGADGSILGPRAYSRPRLGSAGLVLAGALVALGWTLRPLHVGPTETAGATLAAAASATAVAQAASAAEAQASSPSDAASGTAEGHAAAEQQAQASAPAAASAPVEMAATPADGAPSQPQASIRPVLSDEERHAARVEAARLRGEPPPAPPATLLPGPVYAVVSPASRQRAAAAGSLAQMKSAASHLDGTAPTHGELLESQGQWRAAWWPFTSLVDAERARILLAGKGVKAEVVEF